MVEHPVRKTNTVADRYLTELSDALGVLPDAARREITAEVRDHIDEAMRHAEQPVTDDSMAMILAKIGAPSEIAAEARERFNIAPPRATAIDVVALILTAIANFVVPVIGILGAALLIRRSQAWTPRTKQRAITALIGGELGLITFVGLAAVGSNCASGSCTGLSTVGVTVLALGAVGSLALPLAVALWLGRRMAPRPALRVVVATVILTVAVALPTVMAYASSVSYGSESTGIVSGDPTKGPDAKLCWRDTVDGSLAFTGVHLSVRYCGTAAGVTSVDQPTCTADRGVLRIEPTFCLAYLNPDGTFIVRAEYSVSAWTLPLSRTAVVQIVGSPSGMTSG